MAAWLSIVAVVVVVLLEWKVDRRFGSDRIAERNERRRIASRTVSQSEVVDGNRHLTVAVAFGAAPRVVSAT